jgi:flagellar motor component MotA
MAVCSELALMDYFLRILQRVPQQGLLALEEEIQNIEKKEDFDPFDLTYIGFRLVLEGWDFEDIQNIFEGYRTCESQDFRQLCREMRQYEGIQ